MRRNDERSMCNVILPLNIVVVIFSNIFNIPNQTFDLDFFPFQTFHPCLFCFPRMGFHTLITNATACHDFASVPPAKCASYYQKSSD